MRVKSSRNGLVHSSCTNTQSQTPKSSWQWLVRTSWTGSIGKNKLQFRSLYLRFPIMQKSLAASTSNSSETGPRDSSTACGSLRMWMCKKLLHSTCTVPSSTCSDCCRRRFTFHCTVRTPPPRTLKSSCWREASFLPSTLLTDTYTALTRDALITLLRRGIRLPNPSGKFCRTSSSTSPAYVWLLQAVPKTPTTKLWAETWCMPKTFSSAKWALL